MWSVPWDRAAGAPDASADPLRARDAVVRIGGTVIVEATLDTTGRGPAASVKASKRRIPCFDAESNAWCRPPCTGRPGCTAGRRRDHSSGDHLCGLLKPSRAALLFPR